MRPPRQRAAHARWRDAHARWQATHRRWRHSIQWRLVTLFLVLASATTGVFLFGMQRVISGGWQGFVKPIVTDYVDRLAGEIGSPPDPARARALVERLPIRVRIDGPTVTYDSHPDHAGFRRFGRHGDTDGDGSSLVRNTADGHRITFGLASPLPSEKPRTFGWLTLAALLLLTLVAYGAVRRLLRPLGPINAGVSRFGDGDFAEPIPVRRRDELGDLAEHINTMARSLKDMLDAKRALLLAISHELRSPLTRARVNAELLPEGEYRDALLRDLGAMRDLITDLLESERLASGHAALQTETVHLPMLVHEVVAAQFAAAPMRLQLDHDLPAIQADPARLKLLLRNLIDNALRHGTGAPRPPEVTLAHAADGLLRLTVRDFGPGVDDEQIEHLTEPFHRADAARARATGGVGLGLYLCRQVVQAHRGILAFAHGRPGLVVRVDLPLR